MPGVVLASAYDEGARYHRHLDCYGDDNARALTLILYANEAEWDTTADGGARLPLTPPEDNDLGDGGGDDGHSPTPSPSAAPTFTPQPRGGRTPRASTAGEDVGGRHAACPLRAPPRVLGSCGAAKCRCAVTLWPRRRAAPDAARCAAPGERRPSRVRMPRGGRG